MLIELGPGNSKWLWYRTFAVEKYEVTEYVFGIVTALFRIALQKNLYAQRVFKH